MGHAHVHLTIPYEDENGRDEREACFLPQVGLFPESDWEENIAKAVKGVISSIAAQEWRESGREFPKDIPMMVGTPVAIVQSKREIFIPCPHCGDSDWRFWIKPHISEGICRMTRATDEVMRQANQHGG